MEAVVGSSFPRRLAQSPCVSSRTTCHPVPAENVFLGCLPKGLGSAQRKVAGFKLQYGHERHPNICRLREWGLIFRGNFKSSSR